MKIAVLIIIAWGIFIIGASGLYQTISGAGLGTNKTANRFSGALVVAAAGCALFAMFGGGLVTHHLAKILCMIASGLFGASVIIDALGLIYTTGRPAAA